MLNKKILVTLAVIIVALGALVFALKESPRSAVAPATEQQGQVTLTAGSSTYTASMQEGETVLAVMQALASTTSFTYSGKTYPSLGLFVESINGTKGSGSNYWILYINGTSSPVGASSATVKPGDTVEWKLEAGQD